MVDIAKIETEAEQVGADVLADAKSARGWLKSAWAWAWNTSWKTKAVVGVILLTGLLCGIARASLMPDYATRTEVKAEGRAVFNAATALAPTREQFNDLEAKVHQIEVEMQAIEDRLATPPAKITTGSIPKKSPVRKPARKPASSSNWFSLP